MNDIRSIVKQIEKRKLPFSLLKRRYCGKMIASGLYRDVYVLKQNPDYVVKIERDMKHNAFVNALEWNNWEWNKGWGRFSVYLAPCHFINHTGNFLIQTRLTRISNKIKDFPKLVPSLFTDKKIQNYGWIGDQFVCCDYPHLITDDFALVSARWWNLHAKPKPRKKK